MRNIQRKTLLYKTKVEYGNWTINHIVGCMHGCKFPCYARMMARKFGWVKDDKDWLKPRLAENALDLLDKEIPKYKKEIDFVHLSFMTDPFMYDFKKKDLVPEIKKLTLDIIKKLNGESIKVTTLTKGFYPDEITNGGFLKNNEYGITLVSLNEKFKREYEPFSAPYELRISSLKKLHDAGLKTWVSLEPYPTPNLDEEAENIEQLLSKVGFVNKIIFGKLNYNVSSSNFLHNEDFYERIAGKVIKFCKENNIEFHIKLGTPLSRDATKNIFKN
ncbi:MAG: radical SAM protein [Candidatus Omnitrophica bacterium]|nr:radical SAM protein [Candidatus Omnitrophota bacterium]